MGRVPLALHVCGPISVAASLPAVHYLGISQLLHFSYCVFVFVNYSTRTLSIGSVLPFLCVEIDFCSFVFFSSTYSSLSLGIPMLFCSCLPCLLKQNRSSSVLSDFLEKYP